jgi:hypothetical protein
MNATRLRSGHSTRRFVMVTSAKRCVITSEEQSDESSGGQGWIRTIEGISQQIYSLPRLATSVPTPGKKRSKLHGKSHELQASSFKLIEDFIPSTSEKQKRPVLFPERAFKNSRELFQSRLGSSQLRDRNSEWRATYIGQP